jgi:hypothetical protein
MSSTFAGVVVDSSLPHWSAVLSQWCSIIERWCDISSPDRPWWHLEVSNAGLIASAAISCGHAALVESSVTKTRGSGRSDLWIQFGRQELVSGGSTEEFVELKLSTISDGIVDVQKLSHAMRDAGAIDWPCRRKLGGCLYSVIGSGDNDFLRSIVDKVAMETKADGIAWIFPGSVREVPGKNGLISPGVIFALKSVGPFNG